jgi:hypothetical protein
MTNEHVSNHSGLELPSPASLIEVKLKRSDNLRTQKVTTFASQQQIEFRDKTSACHCLVYLTDALSAFQCFFVAQEVISERLGVPVDYLSLYSTSRRRNSDFRVDRLLTDSTGETSIIFHLISNALNAPDCYLFSRMQFYLRGVGVGVLVL